MNSRETLSSNNTFTFNESYECLLSKFSDTVDFGEKGGGGVSSPSSLDPRTSSARQSRNHLFQPVGSLHFSIDPIIFQIT